MPKFGATGCRRDRHAAAARFASLGGQKYGSGSRRKDFARPFGVVVSDIFREIDEELRRDNLLKLWKLYGKYVILAAVLAVAIAGLIVAWRDHQTAQRREQSVRYSGALALARDGKEADAAKLFAALSQEGGGYGVLAAFEQAELLAKSGDRKAAAAAYDRIAASSDFEPEFRGLATLLSVMNSLPEGDPKAAIERLEPLTQSGNPWRASALELTAAAKLKSGDRGGALEIYQKLADDLAAPQRLRARAAEMAAALKS